MQKEREKLEDEILILQQERWQEWQDKYLVLTQLIENSLS